MPVEFKKSYYGGEVYEYADIPDMTCQRCGADEIVRLSADDDMFGMVSYTHKKEYIHGGVMEPFATQFGDFEINICLSCGQAQGEFPVTVTVRRADDDMDYDEEDKDDD